MKSSFESLSTCADISVSRHRQSFVNACRADLTVGAHVHVLPGRQFPAFSAGDVGVVVRIDEEARTCDVNFAGGLDDAAVTVATRHLCVDTFPETGEVQHRPAHSAAEELLRLAEEQATLDGSSGRRPRSGSRRHKHRSSRPADPAHIVSGLEASTQDQKHIASSLESSVMACENAASNLGRTEESERSFIDGSQEKKQHTQSAAMRDDSEHFHDLGTRFARIEDWARNISQHVRELELSITHQETRASSIESCILGASENMARTESRLHLHESRVSALGCAIETAKESVERLHSSIELNMQTLAELEQVGGRTRENRRERCERPNPSGEQEQQASEPVWQALRNLQELVVHEAENRAACVREVLGVLAQGIEQLRGEQGRHVADFEARYRGESRRAKQRVAEAQARNCEHDMRAEAIEHRLDALARALGSERCCIEALEHHVREAYNGREDSFHISSPNPHDVRDSDPVATEIVTSQSLSRLEALEVRLDLVSKRAAGSSHTRDRKASCLTPRTAASAAIQPTSGPRDAASLNATEIAAERRWEKAQNVSFDTSSQTGNIPARIATVGVGTGHRSS